MQTILIAGVLNQPFGSWPVASQSTDGVIWTTNSIPFQTNDFCTSIATDGTTAAVSNQRGWVSTSTDMLNWSINEINDGFGTTCINQSNNPNSNAHWLAVGSYNYINGYGPYPPKTQVAQIYRANQATGLWQMVFTHPNNNSIFYSVSYFSNAVINQAEDADVWIALGSNGIGSGIFYYSLDYGISWVQGVTPAGIGTLFSVNIYQIDGVNLWIWATNNKLYTSTELNTSFWNEVFSSSSGPIVQIVVENQNNIMAINTINSVYFTIDGLEYQTFSVPGYVFNSLQVLPLQGSYRWLAFARSTLTQYTMWYTDNFKSWTPLNNTIEVQGSAINV
jgi:hypothetical protein